jgi:AraC-like DNA-binding protein
MDRYIECLWTAETQTAARDHAVPPDGCLDLVYSAGQGVLAVGTMTVTRVFPLPANTLLVGVRFRPGMAGPFLHTQPAELTDRLVDFEDLAGARARRLKQHLCESCSAGAAIARLAAEWLRPEAEPDPAQRAIEAMVRAHGETDLEWAARQANLSPRQFRRRTIEHAGLTPKQLCRILRFQRALKLARTGLAWAQVAAECGYYDQSHLIRDFREFTGAPPLAAATR